MPVAEPAHLARVRLDHGLAEADLAVAGDHHPSALADAEDGRAVPDRGAVAHQESVARAGCRAHGANRRATGVPDVVTVPGGSRVRRSEEHTSELQSLMRISYAVFC